LIVALCAACTSTVRDYPADEPAGATALLAGGLAFGGSYVAPVIRLRAVDGGRYYVVRPEHDAFLVAVPAGLYEIERFGDFRVTDDRLTVLAVSGEARYIGTFHAMRTDTGQLRVVVRDELEDVARRLEPRYGERALVRGLVQSALEPMAGAGDELVIAVRPIRHPGYPYWAHDVGIYYGYGYWYGHPHHRRPPPRPPRPRPSRASGGYHQR
jgi:hypothetical protein